MADKTRAILPMRRALKASKAKVPRMNGMEAMTLKMSIMAKAGKIFLAAFFFLSRAETETVMSVGDYWVVPCEVPEGGQFYETFELFKFDEVSNIPALRKNSIKVTKISNNSYVWCIRVSIIGFDKGEIFAAF